MSQIRLVYDEYYLLNANEGAVAQQFAAVYQAYQDRRQRYLNCFITKCGRAPEQTRRPAEPPGSAALEITGVTSVDPNDKYGPHGALSSRYIDGNEELKYFIEFENLPTATAPAQRVIITDQLDPTKADLSTFALGPISFAEYLLTPPAFTSDFRGELDLRPDRELVVKVSAHLARSTGLITWRFDSVDPGTGEPPQDALAGFLPPNRVAPQGQGTVSFSVQPLAFLETGSGITNSASIVFDDNELIVTPQWLNTIDRSTPASRVMSMPSSVDSLKFSVAWSGDDTGSGVRDYSIFVSDNGGPFTQWLTRTPVNNAEYIGLGGHTYSFYSIARDHAGNVEKAKATPESTTMVNFACASNVTTAFLVARGGLRYNNATRRYVQMVTLRNTSGVTVQGPVSLALDNLSTNASLFNPGGVTLCEAPLGSVFVDRVGNVPQIPANMTIDVVLEFENPSHRGITYSTRILAGNGMR